jgi:hypothetical protein
MLERTQNIEERSTLIGKFNVLLTRAGVMRGRHFAVDNDYFQKVAEKLARRSNK